MLHLELLEDGESLIAIGHDIIIDSGPPRFIDVTSLDSREGFHEFIRRPPEVKIRIGNLIWNHPDLDRDRIFSSGSPLLALIYEGDTSILSVEVLITEIEATFEKTEVTLTPVGQIMINNENIERTSFIDGTSEGTEGRDSSLLESSKGGFKIIP